MSTSYQQDESAQTNSSSANMIREFFANNKEFTPLLEKAPRTAVNILLLLLFLMFLPLLLKVTLKVGWRSVRIVSKLL